MTNLCLSLVLAGGVLLSASLLAPLPGNVPTNASGKFAQSVDSMAAFWEKFKAAVIQGDKETVAALSRFPIARGYGMTSLKNKAQLMKHYRDVFFNETDAAKCFPKAKPYVEKGRHKEFTISCSFARDGGNEEPSSTRLPAPGLVGSSPDSKTSTNNQGIENLAALRDLNKSNKVLTSASNQGLKPELGREEPSVDVQRPFVISCTPDRGDGLELRSLVRSQILDFFR